MLVFITSVRHPINSKSYEKVESLLARTLDSVCNQTDSNFHVIVICNQLPDFKSSYPKVDFLEVDFPPPSLQKTSKIDIASVNRDKGTKRVIGLLHAAKYNPDHIMFFDADDLLSNRIAQFVNLYPEENGWFVQNGYVYGDGMSLLMPKHDFHLGCGSSIILNYKLLKVPSYFPEKPSQELILEKIDSYFLKNILGDHSEVKDYFRSIGYPIKPLPFSAAIWVVNNGENHSVEKGVSGVLGHPITQAISDEFNLEFHSANIHTLLNLALKLPKAIYISLTLLLFRDLRNYLYHRLSRYYIFNSFKNKIKGMIF